MCGHFGWYIHTGVKQRELAVMAAVMGCEMETRGPQSFGYYQPTVRDEDGHARLVKETGPISENASALDMARAPLLIGHTRTATTGAVTKENTHPFVIHGKESVVVGAHNGIIQDHDGLNKAYNRTYKVDSQHIFGHIADGLDLGDLSGYGAIVYMHSKFPGKILMGRFNHGSLSVYGIGPNDRSTGIIWASTKDACVKALSMAGIKESFPYEISNDKLYFVERGRLFTDNEIIKIMPSAYTSTKTNTGTKRVYGFRDLRDLDDLNIESWRGTSTKDDKKTTDFESFKNRRLKKKYKKDIGTVPMKCIECNTTLDTKELEVAKWYDDGWVCRFCFVMFCHEISKEGAKEAVTGDEESLPAVYRN